MRTKEIAEKLSYLEKKVLLAMDGVDEASPEEIMDRSELDKLVEVMNGISWNQMKGLLTVEEKVSKVFYLSSKDRTPRKLPERKVLEALYSGKGEGLVSDLESNGVVSKDEVSAAVGWMKKKGWAQISKAADGSVLLKLTDDGKSMIDHKGIDEILLDDLLKKADLSEEEGSTTSKLSRHR
jgi:phenylalanyl-tRNA synthetase alpha chain